MVLGFQNRFDCTPAAAELAKAVLDAAEFQCIKMVFSVISAMETLVSPPPVPALSESFHNESDDDSDNESLLNWEAYGQARTVQLTRDTYSMQFHNNNVEAAFTAMHNGALAKYDMCGCFICFCAILYILYVPGTKFHKLEGAEGVQLWRAFTFYLPMLFFITETGRKFYCLNREYLIIYIYFTNIMWNLHVKNYLDVLDPLDFSHAIYMRGCWWVGVPILLFRMRFRLLFPIVIASFAAAATLMPTICSKINPNGPILSCVGYELCKVAAVVVLPPLMVVRGLENSCRKSFMGRFCRN